MLINLLDIPIDGKSWTINQKSGDLNESLQDLIGDSPFITEFTILPMQTGTYDLRGFIKTNSPEDCSRCGIDFKMDISEKFHELLMPEIEMPRNGHYSKANHVSDLKENELNVVEFKGQFFNVGDYLHEIIALAQPLNPAPSCDASGKCSLCQKDVSVEFRYEDPGFETPQKTPFDALKNIKLN